MATPSPKRQPHPGDRQSHWEMPPRARIENTSALSRRMRIENQSGKREEKKCAYCVTQLPERC